MGDMLELGSQSVKLHQEAGSYISRKPIDMFLTLGDLAKMAAQSARAKSRNSKKVFGFDCKTAIIIFLRNNIKSGDIILVKGSRCLGMEEITNSLLKSK